MKGWLSRSCLASALGLVLVLAQGVAQAQVAQPNQPVPAEADVQAWLLRAHDASRERAYTGTFVVSAGASMASAKIWHICDGTQQMERIETLNGPPRATFRRDDQVVTFYPDSKVAVSEKRETLGLFPNLLRNTDNDIGNFYQLKILGSERVVGLDAEVAQLLPKDKLRYGYKVWSEKKTGLVLRLQILDAQGRVLEQSAFSELQLDAPVSMSKLSTMMAATDGYKVVHPEMQKVDAKSRGWTLSQNIAGFKPTGCFQRSGNTSSTTSSTSADTLQWIFSDGLAHVSLFLSPHDSRKNVREGHADLGGATQSLTRRLGDWWITAVGEVPLLTLNSFAAALERSK